MVRRRQAADRRDEEFCSDIITAVGFDAPALRSFVEGGRRYARIEQNMLTKIEPIGHMIGVSEYFGLRRVFF